MKQTKTGLHKIRDGILTSLAALAIALLGSGSARAQTCQLYPIALSAQSLANVTPGTIVSNIWNGSQPGNFGWLSWTGDPGETTLQDSLTQPGDSSTYINPDTTNAAMLVVGDWVSGKPGVSNSKHVRAALDTLEGVQIVVPVWDQARGEGDNTAYHVSAFAVVQIISYQLPSQNQITAQFLGYSSCSVSTN
jgi:hypothetical protein